MEPGTEEPTDGGSGIRPLAVLNTLLRRRRAVVAVTGIAVATSVATAILAAETWNCTIRFLPTGGASVTGRMSALVGSSIPDEGTNAASGDYYADLLKTVAFAESIVSRPFDIDGAPALLADHWGVSGADDRERTQRAAEALLKSMRVTVAKAAGTAPRLVAVDVSADRRQLCADIATRVLERINEHNADVRGDRSKQSLVFITARLTDSERDLKAATDRFAEFSSRNRKIATPSLVAERDRLEREVRVKEEVFLTLTRQLELAKIEEQDQRVSIEVLQPPQPPLQRSAPRRTQMVAMGGLVGLMLAFAWVAATEWYRQLASSEDPAAREFRAQVRSILMPWWTRRAG